MSELYIVVMVIGVLFILTMTGRKIRQAKSPSKAFGDIFVPLCMLIALVPIGFISGFTCFKGCSNAIETWLPVQNLLLLSFPLSFFVGLQEVVQDKIGGMTKLMYAHVAAIIASTIIGLFVLS